MSRPNRRWLMGQALNPGSLAYLELRLTDIPAGAPDDPVATWADSSGNGRNATGGPNLPALSGDSPGNPNSPSGRQGVWFNSFFNVYMTGPLPGGSGLEPSRGFTFYNWFHEGATNANHAQTLWQSSSGGVGLILADGSLKIGYGDQLGAHISSTTKSAGYHSLVYTFNPPMGTGKCQVHYDGTLILEDDWSFTNGFGPASGYTLSNNTVDTTAFEGIYYELMLFSQAHDAATRAGVLAYGQGHWGF